jgi:hypothetical protein
MIRDDFAVFILTHGRPDRVYTLKTLEGAGYTGPVYLIIDDEDATAADYFERYGRDMVLQFNKREAAERTDVADCEPSRRGVVFARNMCHSIAERLGLRYFLVLDDDYTGFYYRCNESLDAQNFRFQLTMDDVCNAFVDFLKQTPTTTIAFSQGGDHIGGDGVKDLRLRRKAMNSFFCAVDRPFKFFGRINEDTTAYTFKGREGDLYFTVMQVQLNQRQTQSNPGGLTEIYLDSGTYVKSFYSVLYAPSCVKVGILRDPRGNAARFHHDIDWGRCVPKIVSEVIKK